jgi:hypothetical protein
VHQAGRTVPARPECNPAVSFNDSIGDVTITPQNCIPFKRWRSSAPITELVPDRCDSCGGRIGVGDITAGAGGRHDLQGRNDIGFIGTRCMLGPRWSRQDGRVTPEESRKDRDKGGQGGREEYRGRASDDAVCGWNHFEFHWPRYLLRSRRSEGRGSHLENNRRADTNSSYRGSAQSVGASTDASKQQLSRRPRFGRCRGQEPGWSHRALQGWIVLPRAASSRRVRSSRGSRKLDVDPALGGNSEGPRITRPFVRSMGTAVDTNDKAG